MKNGRFYNNEFSFGNSMVNGSKKHASLFMIVTQLPVVTCKLCYSHENEISEDHFVIFIWTLYIYTIFILNIYKYDFSCDSERSSSESSVHITHDGREREREREWEYSSRHLTKSYFCLILLIRSSVS